MKPYPKPLIQTLSLVHYYFNNKSLHKRDFPQCLQFLQKCGEFYLSADERIQQDSRVRASFLFPNPNNFPVFFPNLFVLLVF